MPWTSREREARQQLSRGCLSISVIAYTVTVTVMMLSKVTRDYSDSHLVIAATTKAAFDSPILQASRDLASSSSSLAKNRAAAAASWDPLNPLAIPPGKAPNLPSVRVHDESVDGKRTIYGGTGDKQHLGGFTDIDLMGVSPAVWKFMIEKYGVHSLLDVGCGRGISTLWFLRHGVNVLCAEGSHDAVEKTMLPDPAHQIVEHDFSRGPWWPEKTYDAVWAIEFLEHVSLHHQFNYVTSFRKAALLFVSSSRHGGWHHTEVHDDDWWVRKFEAYGFRYNEKLTKEIRQVAATERNLRVKAPNGGTFNAQHVWLTMKVFVNPTVAALPQHAYLFPEVGCYHGKDKNGKRVNRECGSGPNGALETTLPPEFHPIKLTPEMDQEWENEVKQNIQLNTEETV